MNWSILVIVSYLMIRQAHGTIAIKGIIKEMKTRRIKWERFEKEGWAFDCDIGKIKAKMDLSELYPDEEMEIVGEKNLTVHKMKDYKIGTSEFHNKNSTDMAMIIQNLLTEGLVYMEAIAGISGKGKIMVL